MIGQPLVGGSRFIYFAGGKEGLGIFSVDHIAVDINVREVIVKTYALSLVVEFQSRLIVIDADIGNGIHIVLDIGRGQVIAGGKFPYLYILQVIGITGKLDIAGQIRRFLAQLIGGYHQILYQHRCYAAQDAYAYHNDRHSQYSFEPFFIEPYDEHHCRHHCQYHKQAVYP